MLGVATAAMGGTSARRGPPHCRNRVSTIMVSFAYRFRPYRTGDCPSLLALFERSYKCREAPRSEAHWRWKFEDNPGGSRSLLADLAADGRVVGYVGGTAHRAWHRGEQRSVVQAVDHMVDPDLRQGLSRIGLFARIKRRWVEEFCGRDRCFIGFGFPSPTDFRIGERVARYTNIQPVLALTHDDLGSLERRAPRALSVEYGDDVPRGADGLWERVRDEIELAVVRDAAHLRWRYAAHPDVSYEFVTARSGGGVRSLDRDDGRGSEAELRGVAVVRTAGLADDVMTVMDWVCPQADSEARAALLAGIARRARQRGMGAVATWFPSGIAAFNDFQDEGFRVRHTPIVMAGRVWDRRVGWEELRRAFYLTLGDIDYL